ncbi:MAG TPA: type VI secretion system baseplate subunit TssG [Burkholderiales bacterium]|jgi:type VI secretion system protein ImpH|nr:type VI secretion system baseplate subunit TssG [Burkholderiales bacterium]
MNTTTIKEERKPRRDDESVVDALFERPYSFDFYQAVRLLQWLHRHTPAEERPTEAVRYSTRLSLDTPAGDIYELTRPAPRKPAAGESEVRDDVAPDPAQMVINFFGLTGPSGALPLHYTELLLERRYRHRDHTLAAFLNIFNHRLSALFHEIWSKYHIFLDLERETRDGFTRSLLDLVGLGTDGLRNRLDAGERGVSDQSLVYYSGILAQRPHSASGLEAILGDYFRVPAKVLPFQGRWLRVPKSQCSELGRANCALGDGALLGQGVWDQQSKFRVVLGALSYKRFLDFLPNGRGFAALGRLGNFYAGPDLDFDVQLVVKRQEVPQTMLGGLGTEAAHLGWNTWITGQEMPRDADDAVFIIGKAPRWRPRAGEEGLSGVVGLWRPPEAQAMSSMTAA